MNICIYTANASKCLGFAWNSQRIIIIIIITINIIIIIVIIVIIIIIIVIIVIIVITVIIITIIIKPLLKIFNECRSSTGVGEVNPYRRSSMYVEV